MALKTEFVDVLKAEWSNVTPAGCSAFTVSIPANGQVAVWPSAAGDDPDDTTDTSGHLIARGIVGMPSEISGGGLPAASNIWVRSITKDTQRIIVTSW
jgi:hypothetical protein